MNECKYEFINISVINLNVSLSLNVDKCMNISVRTLQAINYVWIIKKKKTKKLWKIWWQNDEPRINHYTVFEVRLNFDKHMKNSFDISTKNHSVERSVTKHEMQKNCFANKTNTTNYILYTIYVLHYFNVFTPFSW